MLCCDDLGFELTFLVWCPCSLTLAMYIALCCPCLARTALLGVLHSVVKKYVSFSAVLQGQHWLQQQVLCTFSIQHIAV